MWKISLYSVAITLLLQVLLCYALFAEASKTVTSPNGNIRVGVNDYGTLYDPSTDVAFVGYNYDPIEPGIPRDSWGILVTDTNQKAIVDPFHSPPLSVGITGLASTFPPFSYPCTAVVPVQTSANGVQVLYCLYFRDDYPYTAFFDTVVVNTDSTAHSVVYRRGTDLDASSSINSFAYINDQGNPSNLKAVSNYGFESADPSVSFSSPVNPPYQTPGFNNYGVGFDINLGLIPAGGSVSFTFFFGAAANFGAREGPTSVGGLNTLFPGQVFYATLLDRCSDDDGEFMPCYNYPVYFEGYSPLLGGSGSCIGVYQCSNGVTAAQFTTYSGGTCTAATSYPTTPATGPSSSSYVAMVSSLGTSTQQTFYIVPAGCTELTIINAGGASGSCISAVNSKRTQRLTDTSTSRYLCSDSTTPSQCGFSNAVTTPNNAAYDTAASAASFSGGCSGTCCCYTATAGQCLSTPSAAAPVGSSTSYKRDIVRLQEVRRNIIAINASMPNILDPTWVQQMMM